MTPPAASSTSWSSRCATRPHSRPSSRPTSTARNVLLRGVEDHVQNFTRFHLIRRSDDPRPATAEPDKISIAFALEHRPGTLVHALQALASAGVNLTRIESRPVPGQPWEYVFFVEFRFPDAATRGGGARRAPARNPHAPRTRPLQISFQSRRMIGLTPRSCAKKNAGTRVGSLDHWWRANPPV